MQRRHHQQRHHRSLGVRPLHLGHHLDGARSHLGGRPVRDDLRRPVHLDGRLEHQAVHPEHPGWVCLDAAGEVRPDAEPGRGYCHPDGGVGRPHAAGTGCCHPGGGAGGACRTRDLPRRRRTGRPQVPQLTRSPATALPERSPQGLRTRSEPPRVPVRRPRVRPLRRVPERAWVRRGAGRPAWGPKLPWGRQPLLLRPLRSPQGRLLEPCGRPALQASMTVP